MDLFESPAWQSWSAPCQDSLARTSELLLLESSWFPSRQVSVRCPQSTDALAHVTWARLQLKQRGSLCFLNQLQSLPFSPGRTVLFHCLSLSLCSYPPHFPPPLVHSHEGLIIKHILILRRSCHKLPFLWTRKIYGIVGHFWTWAEDTPFPDMMHASPSSKGTRVDRGYLMQLSQVSLQGWVPESLGSWGSAAWMWLWFSFKCHAQGSLIFWITTRPSTIGLSIRQTLPP